MTSTLVSTIITTFLLTITYSQIYVDDDSTCTNDCGSESNPHPTIQAALDDVSNNQGSITLKAGTYTGEGNINLTVQNSFSQLYGEGCDITIIDCENTGYMPGFKLNSGTFRIEGISIKNCKAIERSIDYNGNPYGGHWGGALFIESTYTVIRDIIVEGNEARDNGGGIAIFSDTIEIYNSTIRDNKAENGGGIFISKAYLKLENVTIEDNKADGYGGGMYGANGGQTDLFGTSMVKNNQADGNGDEVACVNMTTFFVQSDNAEIDGDVYCDGSCVIGTGYDNNYCDGNNNNNNAEMIRVVMGCIGIWVLMIFKY